MLPKRIKSMFKRRKNSGQPGTSSNKYRDRSGSSRGSSASAILTPPIILGSGFSSTNSADSSSSQLPLESEGDFSRGSGPLSREPVDLVRDTEVPLDEAEGTSIVIEILPSVVEELSRRSGSLSTTRDTVSGIENMAKASDDRSTKSGSPGFSMDEVSPLPSDRDQKVSTQSIRSIESDIHRDPPHVAQSYDAIPFLEQITLPRGGISMDTQAVGRVQFGIPPETIKDSMRLGLAVPEVYIVPVERFCREMGPALGVNLAEFEFPAYFNFFVHKKRCTLIVDNEEAERNIRLVFSETLLGPSKFRREEDPIPFEEEDFDPEFPREAIPNFTKELKHFRIMPDGKELVLETLLKFRHFDIPRDSVHDTIGVPPPLSPHSVIPAEDSVESMEELFEMEEELESMPIPIPQNMEGIESQDRKSWAYSQVKCLPVSVVYPTDATPEQIMDGSAKRVEIFKMPGGTEYIVHDIDENNVIVGKARFAGHVKVSSTLGVDGFGGIDIIDEAKEDDGFDVKEDDEGNHDEGDEASEIMAAASVSSALPPAFYPPSFGVTVLGNSHGFDKSGSVSGYVLWVNGRGIMIDPPPYSSATLEREGIRPRTIVGIILTHCHADHDAGAFQKVLTGSQVVVITTPTIYQSFIRKYAALSALSPALLRHSHRHKPAIIGTPLRFQGATFHFTYTLHTIPCVGFRVEWRGRSMVFTGDHFNSPPAIDKLQDQGVLSKARADDLRNLPLQDTDVLLHEAGAPPIHTPLEVLMQLPNRVKRRLYVVHTSALPPDCELRVAPTGTAGTIRLDQQTSAAAGFATNMSSRQSRSNSSMSFENDSMFTSPWSNASSEYGVIAEEQQREDEHYMSTSFSHLGFQNRRTARSSMALGSPDGPPLVSLRPASSTDAWYILNLLSAVPFLTSLSYASTMELLETARVDAFCKDDVILPVSRRNSMLCVIWEGTCVEVKSGISLPKSELTIIRESGSSSGVGAAWYAGDWTGPLALQPEKQLSGDSDLSATHDIVAMSSTGVKVITVDFASLHDILKSGSKLYRKYVERRIFQQKVSVDAADDDESANTPMLLDKALRNLNVLELVNSNSALKKFSAVQKRHLECLAEGPIYFSPGERLWRAGAPVDRAFLLVSGTASFVPKRRNAGSAGVPSFVRKGTDATGSDGAFCLSGSIGEQMRMDAMAAIKQLGKKAQAEGMDDSSLDDSVDIERRLKALPPERASHSVSGGSQGTTSLSTVDPLDIAARRHSGPAATSVHRREDTYSQCKTALAELEGDTAEVKASRRRSSRARFANKVLGRLYSRRAYTAGMAFGAGHFLGDVSKMVAGLVTSDVESQVVSDGDDGSFPKYGFGDEGSDRLAAKDVVIYEHGAEGHLVHTSTLAAGKEGCVVLVFPKASLIPFLDEYPGLLLSLLGTQVVV